MSSIPPAIQAKVFVDLLNDIMKTAQEGGVSSEVISICLVRMAAALSIDGGQTREQFSEYAFQEYGNVPLKRKLKEEPERS